VLGSVLAIIILIYICYLILFPLVMTIGGGFQIIWFYTLKKKRLSQDCQERLSEMVDPDLGLTMADGGDRTEKKMHSKKKWR